MHFFLTVLQMFCRDVVLGSFVLCGQHFLHPVCTNFSAAKISDDGHNCLLPIPVVAQFTWCDVTVIPNQHINSLLSLPWLVSNCWAHHQSPSFSPPLKQCSQHLTAIISLASSSYTLLRCLCASIRLQPSTVRKSNTTIYLVCTSTTFAICTATMLNARTDRSTVDPGVGGKC